MTPFNDGNRKTTKRYKTTKAAAKRWAELIVHNMIQRDYCKWWVECKSAQWDDFVAYQKKYDREYTRILNKATHRSLKILSNLLP